MLKTLRNAWKVLDIRKKLLITLALLMVYRAGVFIPVPGINAEAIKQLFGSGMLYDFFNLISGGSFKNMSIFALGVTPYINSSIIMSLLTIAIPKLETLSKEGEEGRKKIAEYTRYGALFFALLQGFSISMLLRNGGALINNSWVDIGIIILTLLAGTTFVMWLGEKITEFGLGNGTSLIIFTSIISQLPGAANNLAVLVKGGSANLIQIVLFLALALIAITGVVAMDLGERRIPVQYAQRRVGMKTYGGQSTHIPINVNSTGVIAIIFAMSVMQFPLIITQLFLQPTHPARILFESGILSSRYGIYPVIMIILIIFFTWFYTSVTFKPDEVAKNLQKSGGFVPGIRPGQPTEEYITRIMSRMTVIGGLFASLVAVLPVVIGLMAPQFGNIYFGGTSLLICVGVALEMNKQIKAQLVMRHYEGFLK